MKLAIRWLVAAALTAVHSAAGPVPRLAFESALTKVFPDAPAPEGSTSWRVSMARGERECFQLLVEAGGELKKVTVESIPPRGLEVELSLVGYARTVAGSIKGYTRDPREYEKAHRDLLEAAVRRKQR